MGFHETFLRRLDAPLRRPKALAWLVLAVALAGCLGAGDSNRQMHDGGPGSPQTIQVDDATYALQDVPDVGPGSGAWVGWMDVQDIDAGIYAAIDARIRSDALDAVFVAVLDAEGIDAFGNFFHDSSGESTDGPLDFGLRGVIAPFRSDQLLLVVWSGLEERATVRIGLPEGTTLVKQERSEGGIRLDPASMGDDGPLVHAGTVTHTIEGPALFWGDLALDRLARGNVSVALGSTTYDESVEGGAVPDLRRFAAALGPGDVRVSYSLTSVGEQSGLYGGLIPLPDGVTARGWLDATVCGICG